MSAAEATFALDKRRIAQHFNRAAQSYQQHNHLQRDCAALLQQEFDALTLASSSVVLDVGCGPGVASGYLAERCGHYFGLDIAPSMVAQARMNHRALANQFICADADALPIPDQSIDCIYSNLTLQWCTHLEQTLAELTRTLCTDGCLLATTVLAGSLEPLATVMRMVDGAQHSNRFLQVDDVQRALSSLKSTHFQFTQQDFHYCYASARDMFGHLRGIGANYTAREAGGLRSRAWLRAIEAALEPYRNERGFIQLKWNIGLIKAFKIDE
ncbi:hypothetical protein CWE22_02745 [Pseudidiomarina aestuarii]|uniref:Methyltransferase type 11 domain-containing protein n=1 Tax=Pseudidiomarina aestuarii TaxID=624146 RepID=A0A7Z7ETJ4_9GAMM|nr:methyltransferase domain-containing protein [Pseudidiomarina aestuarii]RUO41122.1 hypothetical protein CWE22_02745 [Pseudidiomarina aestuarii]